MNKIFFILFIFILFPAATFAQSDAVYDLSRSKENSKLQELLLRFDSLLRTKKSFGSKPKLQAVEEDVGCSIRLTKKSGRYYSIYFNEFMKINGSKISLKKVDDVYPELKRKQDTTHTFYLASSYLVDIETISEIQNLDSGNSQNVIVRVGSKDGITIVEGYQYCGC